jgi:hypothetical protein
MLALTADAEMRMVSKLESFNGSRVCGSLKQMLRFEGFEIRVIVACTQKDYFIVA